MDIMPPEVDHCGELPHGCPHCGTPKTERNGFCATYNRDQRKADSTKVKEKKPIAKVSAKRAVENKEYARLRKEYLEAYPGCEVVECHQRATMIHHIKGRENDLLTDVNYFLAVCSHCHDRIHADTNWAKANGYSEMRSI
jgi:uncharacterized Zn finger protein (UPF0148 family)